VIKYVWRWKQKNGVEDLRKAKQYIEFLERGTGAAEAFELKGGEKR
jgi:hypothetical protein